ncbi:molybdate transport system regulatory protein [Novosphingobium sp. PhB165]|nr:molybdate transport system regulatory protein [Novosphingobium sp. PhB165]
MGPGKADLLEAIRAHGSISAAARAMDMSYRRAWLLVDAMNRCWAQPLVATSPGRAGGSGAQLTEAGETILAHYRALEQRIEQAADNPDTAALAALLRPIPTERQEH